MFPLLLAAASIGSLALPEPAHAPKKCIVRIPSCESVGAHMDVDDMTTENVQSNDDGNSSASLDAFWTEYRLMHRKAEITAFLVIETIEDLTDVLPHDLKTVHFAQWASNTLTIAEGTVFGARCSRFTRSITRGATTGRPRASDTTPATRGSVLREPTVRVYKAVRGRECRSRST